MFGLSYDKQNRNENNIWLVYDVTFNTFNFKTKNRGFKPR
jgi:hypothetical protein